MKFITCFYNIYSIIYTNSTLRSVSEFPIYLILKYLKEYEGIKGEDGRDMMMIGTYEYCRKLRSWQAMCLLSRFITAEEAGEVAERFYRALRCQTHAAIRYFMEVRMNEERSDDVETLRSCVD